MALEIFFSENGPNLVVKIVGEIDHHCSLEIKTRIDRALARCGAKNVIFDFSGVSFMDSSGIGILIGRYKELARKGGEVYAINIAGDIGRIFNISGLKKIIKCRGTLDEAVKEAGGEGK